MIKICHITTAPQNQIPRIIKECKSAQSIGYSPYIVSQGKTFTDEGIHYIGIPVKAKGRFYTLTKMVKLLYLQALEIDANIYQLHDPPLLLYALKLKRKGKKVIFDSHEFYGEQIREKFYIPKILRVLVANVYMRYEAYVCNHIDAVIQVCTLEGQNYFEGRAARSIFIINTPILKEYVPDNNVPFEQRKCIAHIGSLTYDRGITHLIQAIARTDIKLILCGKFMPEEYQIELMTIPEFSSVDYRGVINTNEVNKVLNECYAGISTLLHKGQYSKIDTLPTKVYEYMSIGLPVIISDTPYAKKMIDKFKFGICVKPDNIEDIADAITYLFNNKSIGKEMGENGRKAILELFNWQIEEKRLIALYNELC